ncbi:hypothetical protein [Arsenophonus endosymbiont of Bemisia tabaci]|nr:hypothetical protein [Arsenophonus endosymbiont of Bemisia tabaci]
MEKNIYFVIKIKSLSYKDNILAGGNGNVILYGKDSNDTLLLTKGYANGG